MARPKKLDPFQAMLQEFGRTIGEQIASTVRASMASAPAAGGATRGKPGPKAGSKRGRPAGAAKPCAVSSCSRPAAAKGLCQNHYAKAKRLGINPDNLSGANLETLAADLRGQRGK